jgi:hypothetical protein
VTRDLREMLVSEHEPEPVPASSVRGPQNCANSRAKIPHIACACASPSPGEHASRFSAGG